MPAKVRRRFICSAEFQITGMTIPEQLQLARRDAFSLIEHFDDLRRGRGGHWYVDYKLAPGSLLVTCVLVAKLDSSKRSAKREFLRKLFRKPHDHYLDRITDIDVLEEHVTTLNVR